MYPQPLHKVSVRLTFKTNNGVNKEGAKIAHDAIKFHYGGSDRYPKPMYFSFVANQIDDSNQIFSFVDIDVWTYNANNWLTKYFERIAQNYVKVNNQRNGTLFDDIWMSEVSDVIIGYPVPLPLQYLPIPINNTWALEVPSLNPWSQFSYTIA